MSLNGLGYGLRLESADYWVLGLRAHIMVTDTDEHFYERADAHIHLANDHTTDLGRGKVSASFFYGAARFNIYVAACDYDAPDHMNSERQGISDYYDAESPNRIEEHSEDSIQNYEYYIATQKEGG